MEYYGGEENCLFSEDTLAWLEETLAEIDAEDPDKPIFVIVHPMVGGTVYGSDEPNTEEWGGLAWYTTQLTDILKQYPQVITFSGHTHTMINDEKSIMQTDFTSVGCGSVYYMAADASYAPLSSGGNAAAIVGTKELIREDRLFCHPANLRWQWRFHNTNRLPAFSHRKMARQVTVIWQGKAWILIAQS